MQDRKKGAYYARYAVFYVKSPFYCRESIMLCIPGAFSKRKLAR